MGGASIERGRSPPPTFLRIHYPVPLFFASQTRKVARLWSVL